MATLWAVSMVRDEADVIGHTLEHLAGENVDGIVIADNRSTDGTRDLLEDARRALGIPIVIIDDPEVGYYQSRKMTTLAARAGEEHGATWILPFDADEVWVSRVDRLGGLVRHHIPGDVTVVEAQLFNHFPSAVDPAVGCPFETIVWRQATPAPLPKIMFRWHPSATIHQGNHGVTVPDDKRWPAAEVEVRHFPYRSAQQFARKARNGAEAYRATDLPDTTGAHWRSYGELLDRHGELVLHEVFRAHFWHLSPSDAGLVRDPAPFRR